MQILPCLGSPAKHSSSSRRKFGSFHAGAPAEHLARTGYVQDIKLSDLTWFPRGSWMLYSPRARTCEMTLRLSQCPQFLNPCLLALGATRSNRSKSVWAGGAVLVHQTGRAGPYLHSLSL